MFSSGGMGLFFNGAENWGLAFGTWPAVTTSSSLSFTQPVGHSQPDSQFQVSMCPHVDCLEVPPPSCPVRWTGMDVCVHLGGGKLHSSSLLPTPCRPLPSPAPLSAGPHTPSYWTGSEARSQSRETHAQAQVAQGRIPQSSRGEVSGKLGRWEGGLVGGDPCSDDATSQGYFHLSNTTACAVNSH